MYKSRCLCGLPTRRIIDKNMKSERVDIPKDTCGHTHGMIYLFPSYAASDGLCERCYKKEQIDAQRS